MNRTKGGYGVSLDEAMMSGLLETWKTAVSVPVCLAGEDWQPYGITDEARKEEARSILKLWKSGAGQEKISKEYRVSLYTFTGDKGWICHAILFTDQGSLLASYLDTMLRTQLRISKMSRWEQNWAKSCLLIGQLAGSEEIDFEMKSYFEAFNITHGVKRCAILCFLKNTGSMREYKGNGNLWKRIGRKISEDRFFSKEDIYGQLNPELFLMFKTVKTEKEAAGAISRLRQYIGQGAGSEAELYACVGSVYKQSGKLHQSYLEANYLFDNYDYLNSEDKKELYIKDFVFDYLYTRLDAGFKEKLLCDWNRMLEARPLLSETCIALSQNENSPKRTGMALGIHNNTILQRLQKLNAVTGLDPVHKIQDRVLLRAYALQKEKKTVWNAGIIVQPGSVLHAGLIHLANLVYEKSRGTFQINIHTVAMSGDNYHLFHMMNTDVLDAVSVSVIPMEQATWGRAAVLSLPFLFDSDEEAEFILNKVVVPDLQPDLEAAGIICPCMWSMGWRFLTSRHTPVRVPEDLAGRKIRILASQINEAYYSRMGAIPFQIYYSDIAEALSSGIIECQENPYTNILAMEFYKYQDYVTELKMNFSPEALCFSRKSWAALNDEKKGILMQAVGETTHWLYREQRRMNSEAKTELINHGMQIIVPEKEEISQWKKQAGHLYVNKKFQNLLLKIRGAKKQYAEKDD